MSGVYFLTNCLFFGVQINGGIKNSREISGNCLVYLLSNSLAVDSFNIYVGLSLNFQS